MKKAIFLVSGSIVILALVLYFGQSHLFLQRTPLVDDQIETSFCRASLDYHRSLSPSDLAGIYMCLLGTQHDSIFVSASLFANAGVHCGDNSQTLSIPIDTSVIHTLEHYWRSKNFTSRFVFEHDSVTVNRMRPANGFLGILYASPVKNIDGELFVGMQYWCGPLCGYGRLYKLKKLADKWSTYPVGLGWIS